MATLERDLGHEIVLALPRPVTALHQIELSSDCSLRCPYCPSRHMVAGKPDYRAAQHMTHDILRRALEHVKFYVKNTTQSELNVAGIGESMMRPDFVECLKIVREAVPTIQVVLATNGLHLTDEIAREMALLRVHCWVSLHRPEKAGLAVQVARRHNILLGTSIDPAEAPTNWAGQVDWPVDTGYAVRPCPWIRHGRAMVTSDGRVTACCLDASGAGIVGHVHDPVGSLKTKPYRLCQTCDQTIGVRGFNQRAPIGASGE